MRKKQLIALVSTVMRNTIVPLILILLCTVTLSAKDSKAQEILDRQLSLSVNNRTLVKVIANIQAQTGVKFVYSSNAIQADRKVSLRMVNKTISQFIEEILKPLNISYKIVEDKILLFPATQPEAAVKLEAALSPVQAPPGTITGRVVDDHGDPVLGASIAVKGTSRGTTTDIDGNFKLNIQESDKVLVVSSLGFTSTEVVINNQTTLTIKLAASVGKLDEVIVVGYGSQRKKDLTGAVSVVTAADIANRPIVDAGEALQGKAAGVQVVSNSGKPGAGLSIRIRGASSISAGNEPLYVVDGIPMTDITSLNPNDIASISVLKDAASASIYGTRAANGVVVITTKRGVSGKSSIDFSTYYGITSPSKMLPVINAKQYQDFVNELKGPGTVTDAMVAANNINWPDEVFRNGNQQNYQLSVSGGTEKTQHYISLNYADQTGIIKPAIYNRASARVNITTKATDWLTVMTNTSMSRSHFNDSKDNQSVARGGVVLSALETPAITPKFNPDGTIGLNTLGNGWENPLGSILGSWTKNINDRLISNIGADVKLWKGLVFQSRFGIDYSNNKNTYFLDPFLTTNGRNPGTTKHQQIKLNNFTWLSEQTLHYETTFGKSHLTALAGWTVQDSHTEQTSISGSYLKPEYRNLPWEQSFLRDSVHAPPTTYVDEWALISYLGRITYDYDDKYLFQANVRSDNSSKFAPGNRNAVFPSFSAGWRISREDFMKDVTVINDLKLRGGWGQNGNQEGIGSYSYLPLSSIDPVTGAVTPKSIAPESLTWETSTQTNVGIDATLLNNRLSFTADFYVKNTKNVLINLPLPSQAGFATAPVNGAATRNVGQEFLISSRNIDQPDLKWSTDLNISFNKNEVTRIFNNIEFLNAWGDVDSRGKAIALAVGSGLGAFYGYTAAGVDPANGDQLYLTKDGKTTHNPSPTDRTVIGSAQPTFVYGLTNTLTYKNFDLTVFIQGSQGNKIFNAARLESEAMIFGINQSTAILNRWRKEGDVTDIPGVTKDGSTNNSLISTRFLENGSYLRFKTITLSYRFSPELLRHIGLTAATIYVSGNNLITITKYKGFDPEVSSNGSGLGAAADATQATSINDNRNISIGMDNGAYPQSKMFLFGLNVSL
ncbi:TonB-dependent receptor [Chitinophaga sp. MM2321]|uniref:TonB-dependent receptor n=1 Tax=Chitinophaga sp. MM2321 TaxID=3137178 RepID=UPI0032D59E55